MCHQQFGYHFYLVDRTEFQDPYPTLTANPQITVEAPALKPAPLIIVYLISVNNKHICILVAVSTETDTIAETSEQHHGKTSDEDQRCPLTVPVSESCASPGQEAVLSHRFCIVDWAITNTGEKRKLLLTMLD